MSLASPATVRRVTAALFVIQCLFSAAFIAGATINPILSAQLSGQEALAGLPGTLVLIGGALASYPAGWLSDRVGRRLALSLGFLLGLSGMLVAGGSVVAGSYAGFLAG